MKSIDIYNKLLSACDCKYGAQIGRMSINFGRRPKNITIFDRVVPLNKGFDKGALIGVIGREK